MNTTVTAFLVGAVAGAALVTFMQTPAFRKSSRKMHLLSLNPSRRMQRMPLPKQSIRLLRPLPPQTKLCSPS